MAFLLRTKKPGPLKPTANPYPSRLQKWRRSLGVSFILLVCLGVFLRLYTPVYRILHQTLFEGSSWIQSLWVQPFSGSSEILENTKTYEALKQELARVNQENEALKFKLHTLKQLELENISLKKTINTPIANQYSKMIVPIIASPYDGLHHFFLIKAGREDGLTKDQAVIAPEGVVGRIEKAGQYTSRVLLLNDSNSRIPVKTEKSDQMAILAGDGSFFPALVYVADARKIEIGESVFTSGIGGIFPPGIPVGRVDEIVGGKISIRPYVSFQKLDWVHILKPLDENYTQELNEAKEGE